MRMYEQVNKELGTNYKRNKDIDWYIISCDYILSEEFIQKYQQYIYWRVISHTQKLSEDFIERYEDKLCWWLMSMHQKFSESFMDRHSDKIEWAFASKYQCLTEFLIDKHVNDVDWNHISIYQNLSEEFIERHEKHVYWHYIYRYQKLSESFIDNHSSLVNWNMVSMYQKLSENFIKKHSNDVSWNMVSRYQKLSDDVLKKYVSYNRFRFLENNWLYKSTEEKKEAVIDTGKYECYDDYFIAYKSVRKDRYSLFNFQYKYEKGGVYESWCDCTNEENSFGLNVGTERFANEYAFSCKNYVVLRCKVRYEDVGRIVHNGDKIRCFKIEILD